MREDGAGREDLGWTTGLSGRMGGGGFRGALEIELEPEGAGEEEIGDGLP